MSRRAKQTSKRGKPLKSNCNGTEAGASNSFVSVAETTEAFLRGLTAASSPQSCLEESVERFVQKGIELDEASNQMLTRYEAKVNETIQKLFELFGPDDSQLDSVCCDFSNRPTENFKFQNLLKNFFEVSEEGNNKTTAILRPLINSETVVLQEAEMQNLPFIRVAEVEPCVFRLPRQGEKLQSTRGTHLWIANSLDAKNTTLFLPLSNGETIVLKVEGQQHPTLKDVEENRRREIIHKLAETADFISDILRKSSS